jgi:teichuronic acid biosynthesis glycosyltransferase TuaG
MPRVSVIIPAFNAEAHIAETLRSIEAQKYADWEVVIADDGSTDRTVEVAQMFGERFAILQAARNEGPAAARNRAVAASKGDLLAFLDADDLWTPDYLDRQVRLYDDTLEQAVRVGLVACDARVLGPHGFLPKTYMELIGFPREVTLTRLLMSNPIFVSTLSPRAVVDEAGGFSPEVVGTEDHDLWLRIVELGYRVVSSREPLAIYRLGAESVSTDLGRMARALQLTYRRALERGNLTPRQRRIARRQLRLQRALEELDLIKAERRGGGRPYARLARDLPGFVLVAAEHPNRWLDAIRILVGRGSPLSQVAK